MRAILFLASLAASPAMAACPNESEIFSCTIDGKPLQLCHWKGALIYNFGPVGKPELSLSQPLRTIAYTPWPGVSGTIWESVSFPNHEYLYEVWTSVDRNPASTSGLQGGINVLKGQSLVAQLLCDPGTPSQSLDVIYGLKQSIGQCWDFDSQVWSNTCN